MNYKLESKIAKKRGKPKTEGHTWGHVFPHLGHSVSVSCLTSLLKIITYKGKCTRVVNGSLLFSSLFPHVHHLDEVCIRGTLKGETWHILTSLRLWVFPVTFPLYCFLFLLFFSDTFPYVREAVTSLYGTFKFSTEDGLVDLFSVYQ